MKPIESLLAVAVVSITLIVSCNTPPPNNLVTINYTPVGNTDQQNLSTRITSGIFMRFHIDSISNQDSNAVPFSFDPQSLRTIPGGETPISHVCFPNDNAQPLVVPAGQTTGAQELGFVTILADTNQSSVNLRTQAAYLSYITNSNVNMVSSDPHLNPVQYVPNPCSH